MNANMIGGAERRNCAFTGVPTFLRSAYCDDLRKLTAQWAILGVPYDEGSPFAPGSRFAPRSIREHSLRFRNAGVYDSASRRPLLDGFVPSGAIVDTGDVDILPSNPERSLANLRETVAASVARGARPIVLGGDHAISFPVVSAFAEELHVIQLDAHLDYMPVSADLQHTNGQGFRKIHALPTVQSLTQIGIRGLRNYTRDFEDAERNDSRIFTMPQLRKLGAAGALAHLPDRARCYVSIDIDAYDMSLTPGCVSAEPGGLLWDDMTALLSENQPPLQCRGIRLGRSQSDAGCRHGHHFLPRGSHSRVPSRSAARRMIPAPTAALADHVACDIAVIGAGIIGLAAASQLQADGLRVCVVDPNLPASGCSSGNAGYLSVGNCFPTAAPARR